MNQVQRTAALAALIIAAFVCGAFVATVSGGPGRWQGRDPTRTMSWEKAIYLLEDPETSEEHARAAMVALWHDMRRAVEAFATWNDGPPGFYSRKIRERLVDYTRGSRSWGK